MIEPVPIEPVPIEPVPIEPVPIEAVPIEAVLKLAMMTRIDAWRIGRVAGEARGELFTQNLWVRRTSQSVAALVKRGNSVFVSPSVFPIVSSYKAHGSPSYEATGAATDWKSVVLIGSIQSLRFR
jgi:hypothetical protein